MQEEGDLRLIETSRTLLQNGTGCWQTEEAGCEGSVFDDDEASRSHAYDESMSTCTMRESAI